MINDWQNLTKFVVLIKSFVFDGVMIVLMLALAFTFGTTCLCLLLALPLLHQLMVPSKLG